MPIPTDTVQLLQELDGGTLIQKLDNVISQVAIGTTAFDKRKGEIILKLTTEKIGNGSQMRIAHQLKYTIPRMNGKTIEDNTTETTVYVNEGGKTSLFPENQAQMFNLKGDVKAQEDKTNA